MIGVYTYDIVGIQSYARQLYNIPRDSHVASLRRTLGCRFSVHHRTCEYNVIIQSRKRPASKHLSSGSSAADETGKLTTAFAVSPQGASTVAIARQLAWEEPEMLPATARIDWGQIGHAMILCLAAQPSRVCELEMLLLLIPQLQSDLH